MECLPSNAEHSLARNGTKFWGAAWRQTPMATADTNSSAENHYAGIFAEMRTILKQGIKVRASVRPKYRLALIAAAIVMAVCGACNTAIPLLLATWSIESSRI